MYINIPNFSSKEGNKLEYVAMVESVQKIKQVTIQEKR
jgi:hypothetical protein